MAKECIAVLTRYFLLIFNVVWFLVGSFLLGAGTWILVDEKSSIGIAKFTMNMINNKDMTMEEGHILDSLTRNFNVEQFAYAFIGIGVFLLFISTIGALGSARRWRWLIIIYGIFVSVLILLQIGVITGTAVNKPNVEAQLKYTLQRSIDEYYDGREYNRKNAITALWDFMMTKLQCCGVEDYHDFRNSKLEFGSKLVPNTASLARTEGIPISYEEYYPLLPRVCCKESTIDEFEQRNNVNFYLDSDLSCARNPNAFNSNMNIGCYTIVQEELIRNKTLVYGIIAGIICVQILIVLLALYLCNAIGRDDSNIYAGRGYSTANTIQRM